MTGLENQKCVLLAVTNQPASTTTTKNVLNINVKVLGELHIHTFTPPFPNGMDYEKVNGMQVPRF